MDHTRHRAYLRSTLEVDRQITHTRKIAARSLAWLKQHPLPDAFAGRKTQEPFPKERDEEPEN